MKKKLQFVLLGMMFSASTVLQAQTGSVCADPEIISGLPYIATGLTTSGSGNDYSSSDACGSTYMSGEDFVFQYVAPANQLLRIQLSNAPGTTIPIFGGTYGQVGVFLTDGCPDDTLTNCIASSQGLTGNPVIDYVSVESGLTYYIIVSTNSLFGQNPSTAFDISVTVVPSTDAGVSAILSPISGYNLTANELVTISVENFGSDTLSGLSVGYQLDANPALNENLPDTLLPGQSVNFTFAISVDLSSSGTTYDLSAWVVAPGDIDDGNDTVAVFIDNLIPPVGSICGNPYVIPSVPFFQGGMTTDGFGDDYNSSDACGSNYMNENDFVFTYTPVGDEYVIVSMDSSGYNAGLFVLDNCPSDTMANCIASAEALLGSPQVTATLIGGVTYYIIVSSNDPTGLGLFPSIGFSISLALTNQYDGGVTSFVSPVSGYLLSASEPVEIVIGNFGPDTLSGFPVTYVIQGNSPVSETVSQSVLPGGTLNYVFTQTADLSTPGTFNFLAYTTISGDTNVTNDTAYAQITNGIAVSGSLCSSAFLVDQLPYTETAISPDGYGDDYGVTDVCNSISMTGEDVLWTYTPIEDQVIRVSATNMSLFPASIGLFLTQGCPDDTSSLCIGSDAVATGDLQITLAYLTAGETYYVVLSYIPLITGSVSYFNVAIEELFPVDGGVSDIVAPVSDFFLTATEQVTVAIQNFGIDSISNFDVSYSFNFGASVTETVTDIIAPGSSLNYTFTSATVNMAQEGGTFFLSATTHIVGDSAASNDKTSQFIMHYVILPGANCSNPIVINNLPFVATDLTTTGMTNEYGSSDACGSQYLTGSEYVFEYTPQSDQNISITLTNATGTDILLLGPAGNVGVFLVASCPDDTTSVCVASNEALTGNPSIGSAPIEAGVTYYILVSTNDIMGQNPSTDFDIEVREVIPTDGGVSAILSPVSGSGLTTLEEVTVRIKNYGLESIDNFTVTYVMTGFLPEDEIIADTIVPGDSLDHTFANQVDLSTPGINYSITAYTSISGDSLNYNDTSHVEIVHIINTAGASCQYFYDIPSLPFVLTGQTTNGFGNFYNSSDACGSTYLNTNEFVFKYTPVSNKVVDIILSNTTDHTGLFVTMLCPDYPYSQCKAKVESPEGNSIIDSLTLIGLTEYYILVSSDINNTTNFDFEIREHTTGIEELGVVDFTIMPNPARDEISIQYAANSNFQFFEITNLTGQVVYSGTIGLPSENGRTTVDVSSLPKGMYCVRLIGQDTRIHRLVIQ